MPRTGLGDPPPPPPQAQTTAIRPVTTAPRKNARNSVDNTSPLPPRKEARYCHSSALRFPYVAHLQRMRAAKLTQRTKRSERVRLSESADCQDLRITCPWW